MPDTHAVIDNRRATNTAALAQIGAAAVALHRALDCDRHLMARTFVDDASALLENAASFCTERWIVLMALAGRLDFATDRTGWPDMDAVRAVLDEAEGIERRMREGEHG